MKQEVIKEFDLATGELLQILSSLAQTRLNSAPLNGGWTAGQIGDHLLKSYAVAETLNGSVKTTKRAPDQKVKEVSNLFLDFNIKMDSPEAIVPTNAPIDKKDLFVCSD